MKKIPYSPHVKSCGTNYHRFSKKIVETRILYLHNYVYYGEYDGRRISSVRWVQDGVNPTWPP